MKRALAAPLCFLGIACHKALPSVPVSTDAGAPAVDSDEAAARATLASPPRACHVDRAATLSDFTPGEDLEFGEAVTTPEGAVVGLLSSSHGATIASVAHVSGTSAATVVDLGVAAGEVPPPQPFLRGVEVFAAGYVRPPPAEAGSSSAAHATRPLAVFRVSDVAERRVTLTQTSDESPSFDVIAGISGGSAGALLAWDEDAPEGHRGLIRVAVLGLDLRAVVRIAIVSPETTDAERPGLALRAPGGYWLAWIARKTEPARDAGPELEGPSEDRAFRWVELVALDGDGVPIGPARRLTPATGHAAGFSMETHATRLDLYAALDDEPADGAGGAISHIAVDADGIPHAAPLLSSGTARGLTPTVAWREGGQRPDDYGGHLEYMDVADHARLVLLDRTGSARGTATVEPDLDDARLLAEDPGGQILVAAPHPGSAARVFRWLDCAAVARDASGNAAPFP